MAVPQKPLSGWARVSGTTYRAIVSIDGKDRYIFADVNTGEYTVKNEENGDPVGTYDPDNGGFSSNDESLLPNLDKLSDVDKSMIEKTLPSKVYEINEIVAKNSSSQDIENGIGISKSSQKEFRESGQYKKISDTTENENPISIDTSNTLSELNDSIKSVSSNQLKFDRLTYPISQTTDDSQDYIQFTIGVYKPKDLKLNGGAIGKIGGSSNVLTGKSGTITLPIQPSIVDSNSVGWNENNLNPLQVAGLQIGKEITESGGKGIDRIIRSLENREGGSDVVNAGKLLLAQEAVGAQNILSRFGGAVFNPNLELLFTGPQLRPFNFNFRLSPREREEAKVVRGIIRAFKQSMAPKVTTNGLFLAAPNIFEIRYIQAGGADHPSLNRIKLCALKSCVVDYTPENSYMTFNDGANTMVSYNMSLQFQELEPVTDADYQGINKNEIGY